MKEEEIDQNIVHEKSKFNCTMKREREEEKQMYDEFLIDISNEKAEDNKWFVFVKYPSIECRKKRCLTYWFCM